MIHISLDHALTRKAIHVQIEYISLYFSYETLIGCRVAGRAYRLTNVWGPTTGKHFNHFGLKEASIVKEAELNKIIEDYFINLGGERITENMRS